MNNFSLVGLHNKLAKQIKLVKAYTEIKEIDFIITSCRLKPQDYVFVKQTKRINLYRWWFDEFGNSFTISKEKELDIIFNDLRLDCTKIVSTDLYYGLLMSQVAKMSKSIHLIAGKDQDLLQECYLLTFLGIDNYLRSYLYWLGEWQQVSPLLMGLNNLIELAKLRDCPNFLQLSIKENCPIPCLGAEAWLSSLPMPEQFIEIIKKNWETLLTIIGVN